MAAKDARGCKALRWLLPQCFGRADDESAASMTLTLEDNADITHVPIGFENAVLEALSTVCERENVFLLRLTALLWVVRRVYGSAHSVLYGAIQGEEVQLLALASDETAPCAEEEEAERSALLRKAFHSQAPVSSVWRDGVASRRVAAIPLVASAPNAAAAAGVGPNTPGAAPAAASALAPIALLWLQEVPPPHDSAASSPPPAPAAAPAALWSAPALRSLGRVLSAWLLGGGAASLLPWLCGVLGALGACESLDELLRVLCAAVAEHVAGRHWVEAEVRPALVPRAGAECGLLLTPQPRQPPPQPPPQPPQQPPQPIVQTGAVFASGVATAPAGGTAPRLAPSPSPPSAQASPRRSALMAAAIMRTRSFSLTAPENLVEGEPTPRDGADGDVAAAARAHKLLTASVGDLSAPRAAAHTAALLNTAQSGASIVVQLPPPPPSAAAPEAQPPSGAAGGVAMPPTQPPPGLRAKAFPLRHTLLAAALGDGAAAAAAAARGGNTAARSVPTSSSVGQPAGVCAAGDRGTQHRVVEDTHMHVQDVHKPSGDVMLLLGRPGHVSAGADGAGAAASATDGSTGGAGGAGSGSSVSPQSLVLLTLPLGEGGCVLGLYLCFPRRLPGGLLEAVRASGQRLVEQALRGPLLEALHGRMAAEYDTLRSAVPGSYAVLRAGLIASQLAAAQLGLASNGGVPAGGAATINESTQGESLLSTLDFENFLAPTPIPPTLALSGRQGSSKGIRLAASPRAAPQAGSAPATRRSPHGGGGGGSVPTARALAATAPGIISSSASRPASRPASGSEGPRTGEPSRRTLLTRMATAFRSNEGGDRRRSSQAANTAAGGGGTGGVQEEGEDGLGEGSSRAAAPTAAVSATAAAAGGAPIGEDAAPTAGGAGGGAGGVTHNGRPESLLTALLLSSTSSHSANGQGGVGGAGATATCGTADLSTFASSFFTVAPPDEAGASVRQQVELITASIQARLPDAAGPAFAEDLDCLTLTRVLGKGGGGTVFQGSWNSLQVAVKLMEMPSTAAAPPAAPTATAPKAAAPPPPAQLPSPAAAATAAATVVAASEQASRHQLAVRREVLRMGMERALLPAMSHPNILQVYFTFPSVYLCGTSDGRFRLAPAGPDMARAARESCPEGSEPVQPMTAVVCEWADCGSLQAALAGPPFRGPRGAAYAASAASSGLGGLGLPFEEAAGPDMQAVYLTLLDVALALRHLHGCGLVHRDVKPANLLLRSAPRDPRGFTVKLADFGFVLRLSEAAGDGTKYAVADQMCGTFTHMPPEAFTSRARIGASVDVYAFGILMWELLAGGARPFPHLALDRIPRAVLRGARPSFAHSVPLGYRSLAQACWAPETRSRPTAADLVAAISHQLRK